MGALDVLLVIRAGTVPCVPLSGILVPCISLGRALPPCPYPHAALLMIASLMAPPANIVSTPDGFALREVLHADSTLPPLMSSPERLQALAAGLITSSAKARSYKVSSSVTNLFASVYAMPALNDISACRFDLDARVTPSLIEASATALTEGGTLMLTDAGLAATATTLTVCGGTNCSVEQANHTHVICRMPACTAATTATIMLHVSPHGYATHSSASVLFVTGVLSLAGVHLNGTANTSSVLAEGSAAGGVLLTLSGEGFADAPSGMLVEMTAGASEAVQLCTIVSSSTADGEIVCRTEPAPRLFDAAGTLCAVRLSALDASGAVHSIVTLSNAYRLLPVAESLTVASLSHTTGSTLGGLLLCIGGTNQSTPPVVIVGGATCDATNTTWNASMLCCATSVGLANVGRLLEHAHAIVTCAALVMIGLLLWLRPTALNRHSLVCHTLSTRGPYLALAPTPASVGQESPAADPSHARASAPISCPLLQNAPWLLNAALTRAPRVRTPCAS